MAGLALAVSGVKIIGFCVLLIAQGATAQN